MTYKTSLDKLAKIVTVAITVLFFIIIVVEFTLVRNEEISFAIFITILFALIYFGLFSFRPISYKLTENNLIIHRPLSDVKIDRSEIKGVEQLEKSTLSLAVRIFGVGGLFGYWGKFSNAKLGTMTWYATRKTNAVLVTTIHNKKIILTPNEPERFVTEFKKLPV